VPFARGESDAPPIGACFMPLPGALDRRKTVRASRRGAGKARANVGDNLDPERPDVEALLAAIAGARDRQAFARFFNWFAPRIKGQLLAAGAPPATADELVQEVMLNVWRKAGQFDPARGAASTWLYAMTRNAWINHARGRRPLEPAEPEDDGAAAEAPTPEAAAAEAQWRGALQGALTALPAEQVEVLRGCYFAGRSLREEAEARNLPLGTVKTRARLALERLRSMLKSEWNP